MTDIDRYESPTPVRGRRRSMTPGGSTSWITGGDGGVCASVTPSQGRSRGRRRSGSIASQSPSANRRVSVMNANVPSVYQEPLWFAQTSESLNGYNPAQCGHLPRPTALERRHQEAHPAQRDIHGDTQPPAPKPVPLHLKGTEDQWFRNSYEAFADDMKKREMEMRRKQHKELLNEHQYQLHKMHDERRKASTDTCDMPVKGIAVHPRKLEDTAHHHGNLWFGGVGGDYNESVPSSRGSCSSYRRSVTPGRRTPSRKRAVPLQATNPNILRNFETPQHYTHQQLKLDSLKSMQDADRASSMRQHKRLFPNPQTQHTHIEPVSVEPTQHRTVAPYGTASPRVSVLDRTRKMQQLGEALSSYREQTRVHL